MHALFRVCCQVEIESGDAVDILFSDLDNTLIYSHNRKLDDEKIVVEHLEGREQSYMTKRTYNFLIDSEWLSWVPVTTRTEVQYKRLKCMDTMRVKYAIICNGGKLLVDGNEDAQWTKNTLSLVETQIDDLETAINMLKDTCRQAELHRPEIYMCYAKVKNPKEICGRLIKIMRSKNIKIQHDQRKVYLFTESVNKGNAISRFRNRFNVGNSIAAGDDTMDIPMLNEVDYPLAASKIFNSVNASRKELLEGDIFSNQICERLEELHTAGLFK